MTNEVNKGLEENCTRRASRSVFFVKYYATDQVNTNETSGACDTYAGDESCMQGFGGEIWKS